MRGMTFKDFVFNVGEVLGIVMLGILMRVTITKIATLAMTYAITRMLIKGPKHYKSWVKCVVWSGVTFIGIFLICNVNYLLSITMTIFFAVVASGEADYRDIFQWKRKGDPSKYQDVIEFIESNKSNSVILMFEDYLKRKNDLKYLVYKHKFKDGLSFNKIEDKLDIPTQKVTEILDSLADTIRAIRDLFMK